MSNLVAGNVSVDAAGVETYTPNDATNVAKAKYARLLVAASTVTMNKVSPSGPQYASVYTPAYNAAITAGQTPTEAQATAFAAWKAATAAFAANPTPPTSAPVTTVIVPDPTHKQALAAQANLDAAHLMIDVVPFLIVTVAIPASAASDGLQTSQSAGNPTTHPASPKTLGGTIA